MNKRKIALIAGLGIVGGVVTLKALRKTTDEHVDDADATEETDAEDVEDDVVVPEAETDTETTTETVDNEDDTETNTEAADDESDAETTIDEVVAEAERTVDHVTAAVKHGRATVEKAVDSLQQKA